ncbi:ROK family protein [Nocardia asteroides NBRC 15531]|uniref:Sugar kinase n=1 Tax=Nocardia asteroides NBRC 15531 TaxID=1110697 RepID=U5EB44_NOCAS|nr:ROK family protein [Nocardia asteroides]TLF69611.1 ROK family protein [Nocardia asteroides NBRC 15531]UGT49112.1 ROK family protein [Nocardia asteroides]SFL80722.1 glucokinase [Nocardia asteroides]VEG31102.1 N-acetylmannosamine kinase [Nocardia asteroides]GAD83678.1 putative sugar kinase [Nocardia asteroides NBRC 15531]
MTALALDIGATKFAAALVDPDYTLRGVRQAPSATAEPWAVCRDLLLAVAGDNPVRAVGIGSAGPIDVPAGTAAPLNLPPWRDGFAVVAHVQALFPSAVVRFAIDGACLVLAEHRVGGLRGVANGLALTVSSGVGGGIVADGRVLVGRTGNGGHLGHIVVPGDDTPCGCGGFGCVEAVASGMSAARWARARGWTGATGAELAEAALRGEAVPLAAMARAGTALGQAVSSAAALLDVDRVVIGGGFARSGPPLWDPLRAAVARHARLEFLRELTVEPSALTDGATLVGAGVLAVDAR